MSSEITWSYNFGAEDQTDFHTVLLSVPNFMKRLSGKKSEAITTKICEQDSAVKFRTKIVLLGRSNDIIEIYYSSVTPLFVKAVLTICLTRFQERSIVMVDYQTIAANKWQYLTSLYKRDLEQNPTEYVLSDDMLRLKLKLMVNNEVVIPSTLPKTDLSKDFANLLENSLFSDLVMISSDDIEFPVHKAVVSSRSAVLRALLEHDMAEKHSNRVESPFEGYILHQTLTFIYSDCAPSEENISERLLAAADYYQLDRLKFICEEAIFGSVTVENCIDILHLADLHSANNLKKMVLEFIKDGHEKSIITTEKWAKIKSVNIVKTLYEFLVNELDGDFRVATS